jgi:hypothetical protein
VGNQQEKKAGLVREELKQIREHNDFAKGYTRSCGCAHNQMLI